METDEKRMTIDCINGDCDIPPIVSVVIPIYNVESYLPECLKSVCGQTLKNIEIICIDDSSEDRSLEVAKKFAREDKRIQLYQQPHQGVSVARNRGITCSRGTYLLFIDGDDWIEADMLECMVQYAEEEVADIVVCSAAVRCEKMPPKGKRQILSLQKALTVSQGSLILNNNNKERWKLLNLPGGWPFIWNKLIRREIVVENKILFWENLELGEDGLFLQLLYQYISKVVMINPAFYHYRYFRSDSATMKLQCSSKYRFSNHLKVIENMLLSWKERGLIEKNENYLLEWIVNFLYGDFIYLIVDERVNASERLKSALLSCQLSRYINNMKKQEKKRMQNMINKSRSWGKIRKWKEIFLYKAQEHFRKIYYK